MAHLLSELRQRLELIGRTKDGSFELPLTQGELADCLGLSAVHVNRVIQQLRGKGLMSMQRKEVHVIDKLKMEKLGQFDQIYLHKHPSL